MCDLSLETWLNNISSNPKKFWVEQVSTLVKAVQRLNTQTQTTTELERLCTPNLDTTTTHSEIACVEPTEDGPKTPTLHKSQMH